MAIRAFARVALVLALTVASVRAAGAQSLQRLTVESFALTTDTLRPRVNVPFHLIVSLRVRENVSEIDNLDLPMLAALELLGDERQTMAGPSGTQYREVVTVVAHAAGAVAISPATLQAVDAHDGKAKEWYTNGLSLNVLLTTSQVVRGGAILLLRVLAIAGGILLVMVLGAAAILTLILVRRRPVPVAPVVAPPPPAAPIERTRAQEITDALMVLQAERTRAAAVRVRAAIWRTIGAAEGETLGDVLTRPAAGDPTARAMLIALERSAFTYDDDLTAAIEDACAALRRYAESLT